MSNRANTARRNLKDRIEDYDLNVLKLPDARAYKRPGSQNAHKQGAGGRVQAKKR